MSIFTGWKTATLFCLFLIGWLADQRYPVLPAVLQQHAPYRHGVQVSPEQQDILGIIRLELGQHLQYFGMENRVASTYLRVDYWLPNTYPRPKYWLTSTYLKVKYWMANN